MRTIEIPGGWANLRETSEMKQKHRRLIEIAAMAAAHVMDKMPDDIDVETTKMTDIPALTKADAAAITDLQDATIIALLDSWTLPQPLPTLDTIGDLDIGVYDALAAEASKVNVAATRVSFEPNPDQASPTSPSSASDGLLRDEPSTSTPTLPSDGACTPTESSIPA